MAGATRKEQLANGVSLTPLTREEVKLAGGKIVPLTEKERFQNAAYGGGGVTPTGTISITQNGEDIDVAEYATANVNVPNPSTGTMPITENGEYNVSEYATAEVDVEPHEKNVIEDQEVTTQELTGYARGNIEYARTVRDDFAGIQNVVVTFEDNEYEMPCNYQYQELGNMDIVHIGEFSGGTPLFDNYPVAFMINTDNGTLYHAWMYTAENGTYQVEAWTTTELTVAENGFYDVSKYTDVEVNVQYEADITEITGVYASNPFGTMTYAEVVQLIEDMLEYKAFARLELTLGPDTTWLWGYAGTISGGDTIISYTLNFNSGGYDFVSQNPAWNALFAYYTAGVQTETVSYYKGYALMSGATVEIKEGGTIDPTTVAAKLYIYRLPETEEPVSPVSEPVSVGGSV